MLLSEFKDKFKKVTEATFLKPDGVNVPKHFRIAEVGQINKLFIDCDGTIRNENVISMQPWESKDFWYRVEPSKLISIIDLSIDKLGFDDHEIEIEYQNDTIGKYGVLFDNGTFNRTTTNTACLASDKCGIPTLEKVKETVQSCWSPNSGGC